MHHVNYRHMFLEFIDFLKAFNARDNNLSAKFYVK